MLKLIQYHSSVLAALILFTATAFCHPFVVLAKFGDPSVTRWMRGMTRRIRRDDRQDNNKRVDNKKCESILSIALQADIDSSDGLNVEEFYGFFNIITSGYYESHSDSATHSLHEIFFRLVGTNEVNEEDKIEVPIYGFDKAEKDKSIEEKEYGKKYCNAVFQALAEEGLDYSSIEFSSLEESDLLPNNENAIKEEEYRDENDEYTAATTIAEEVTRPNKNIHSTAKTTKNQSSASPEVVSSSQPPHYKNTLTGSPQCDSILVAAFEADQDLSNGLDKHEFYDFLNAISSGYLENRNEGKDPDHLHLYRRHGQYVLYYHQKGNNNHDSTESHSHYKIFFRLIGTDELEDSVKFVTVPLDGLPKKDNDEKDEGIMTEVDKEFGLEFCKAVLRALEEEGVDASALFDQTPFSEETNSAKKNEGQKTTPPSSTHLPTSTSTSATSTTNTTTSSSSTKTTTITSTYSSDTTILSTTLPETTTAVITTTTSTSSSSFPETTTTASTKATTPLPETTTHQSTKSSTTSTASTTSSTSLRISSTTSSTNITTSSGTPINENTNVMGTSETESAKFDGQPKADSLAKRIREETNHLETATVATVSSSSTEGGEEEVETKRKLPSTSTVVAAYFGIAAMAMLIVFVVTKHPYFDPREPIV